MTYIKRKSMKQEARVAKDFGGKVQVASGAIPSVGMKGDVRTSGGYTRFNENDLLIENKFTDYSHFTFTKKVWEKLDKEALKDGMRIPLLQVDTSGKRVFILKESDFLGFYNEDYPRKNIVETGTTQVKLKDQYLPGSMDPDVYRFRMPFGTFIIIDYDVFTGENGALKGMGL